MSKRATFPLGKAASKKLMSSGATASRGQDFLATLQRGHDVFGGVMGLDVVEIQGGAVVRGEEVPRSRGSMVEHVARVGRRLSPFLPRDAARVELVEEVVHALMARALTGDVAVGER